jgi:hypothetical protein
VEKFPAMNKESVNGFGHGLFYSRALYKHVDGVTDRNPEKFSFPKFNVLTTRSKGTTVNDYMAT